MKLPIPSAQVRMLDAFNPFDEAIPKVRNAGFTTCCTLPGSANVIGGTGFSFKLKQASTVQDMMIPGTEVMKMALGGSPALLWAGQENADDPDGYRRSPAGNVIQRQGLLDKLKRRKRIRRFR